MIKKQAKQMQQVGFTSKHQPQQPSSSNSLKLAGSVRVKNQPAFGIQQQPQFSGLPFNQAFTNMKLSASAGSMSIFQNIVEKFLWGFLAQDVVGMWIPRIGVSLKRGRIPYDPNQDAQNKNLPFTQQIKLWVKNNAKGLNWINFMEEAGREFATGPGVLVIPTLLYSIARRKSNQAVELAYPALKTLSTNFQEYLSTNPSLVEKLASTEAEVFKPAVNEALHGYLKTIFTDASMKSTQLDAGILKTIQANRTKLAKLNPQVANALKGFEQAAPQNIDAYLDQVISLWLETATNKTVSNLGGKSKKAALKLQEETLNNLIHELEVVTGQFFNTQTKLKQGVNALRNKAINQAELHTATNLYSRNLIQTSIGETTAHHLSDALKKWVNLPLKAAEEKMAGKSGTFAEITQGLYQKLMARKGIFAVGATLLTGVYLIWLARLVQSHDAYPGERLAQQGGHGTSPSSAQAQPQKSNPAQTTGMGMTPEQLMQLLGGAQ